MKKLQDYIPAIIGLCRTHQVKSLYAFGSVLTDAFRENSDVDFVVDFQNMNIEVYADNYFDFKFSLEETLHRPIDLLEAQALKNPYLKSAIEAKKQLVYAG